VGEKSGYFDEKHQNPKKSAKLRVNDGLCKEAVLKSKVKT
jgi:hypothetical protein